MTLQDFILAYDVPGSIVLLEGKRNVLPDEIAKLTALGKLLAQNSRHMLFRSGNASGADFYFSEGVVAVAPGRLQVLTPYAGHRKAKNLAYDVYNLDEANLAGEPDLVYQTKTTKTTEKLVEKYVAGGRDRISIKAAYLLRDTAKVIGVASLSPATAALFYDDLSKPRTGGTGHTMNVCSNNNIPVLDQSVWFSWL